MTNTEQNMARWEGVFSSRPWGRYPPEDLVRFTARTFRDVADRGAIRVLEVGCGPGANLWYLAREGFSVAGIDGSPSAIRQAQERLAAEGLAADLRVGNFERLTWPDASFDYVVDIQGLGHNHMAAVRNAVAEIGRVLKPGGALFSKMFGLRTTGSDTGRVVEPGTRENVAAGPLAGLGLIHFFDEAEIRDLLADFATVTIDSLERLDHGGASRIFEWLVQARR